jgi:molybdopterin synthase catalytic subunit
MDDDIVMVVTASSLRQAAFEAAAFLRDFLKTRAPLWKKRAAPRRHRALCGGA